MDVCILIFINSFITSTNEGGHVTASVLTVLLVLVNLYSSIKGREYTGTPVSVGLKSKTYL